MIRLLRGDCRETLAGLKSGSVQTCITSPPYYGLRSYGTPDLVWGGVSDHQHTWRVYVEGWNNRAEIARLRKMEGQEKGGTANHRDYRRTYEFCESVACGAWRGSLGLEPTPELFVAHIVECFRAVRRVLRDDGVIWVNMGDSYAGSGKGPTGHNGIGNQSQRQGFTGGALPEQEDRDPEFRERAERKGYDPGSNFANYGKRMGKITTAMPGFKAKDLMMMPARVAMALQADGWYLRSMIPWLKRSAMPESVTDRPATSVEYVFLFSKSARYFWDADAVRVPHTDARVVDGKYTGGGGVNRADFIPDSQGWHSGGNGVVTKNRDYNPAGRNWRNGDLFFQSWQGMLLDEDDLPLALVVNPAPLKIAHYASFPPKLVEPMVKASTSEKGCCAECGAPWARVSKAEYLPTDRTPPPNKGHNNGAMGERAANMTRDGWIPNRDPVRSTLGWRPTCAHSGDPVPCAVLDPFAGSGTTLMVADRLGRNAVGCELSDSYSDMGTERVVGDSPMFVQLDSA